MAEKICNFEINLMCMLMSKNTSLPQKLIIVIILSKFFIKQHKTSLNLSQVVVKMKYVSVFLFIVIARFLRKLLMDMFTISS